MRRLALPFGALVAAISFSSCSSVDRGNVAAEVNGHELTTDQLSTLADGSTDGEAIRTVLRTWIEVVAVTDDASGITTATDLNTRKSGALADMLEEFSDAGRTTYEQGLDGSPLLCLSAIPLDTAVSSSEVLDALGGGTTFADAAKQYSIDPSLAESGGIVSSTDGVECLAADQFNTELLSSLSNAGATVGEPALIELQSQEVIVLLRPYDELTLSDPEKLQLSSEQLGTALSDRYAAAEIRIDPRFGTWDAATGQVVALGATVGTS